MDQLQLAADFAGPVHFLGGGSNVVLLPKVPGRVLHIGIRGVSSSMDMNGGFRYRVGAGENWHQFVLHTLKAGVSGLENLALIPGNVGGAPYQNIGAYGRELAEVLHSVEVFDLESKRILILAREQCNFTYRNSIFRSNKIPRLIITHVNFSLGRLPLQADYKDISERLREYSKTTVDHQLIAEVVMSVRRSKLPDLEMFPNVGSFFKNPTLTKDAYDRLQGEIDIVGFCDGERVRIPAARLIDARKWKGKQVGNVLVWHRQPLILVNASGRASAAEFLDTAARISEDVHRRYDVSLEIEPVILGNDS